MTDPAETDGEGVDEKSAGFRTVLRDRPFLAAVGLSFLLIMVFQQAAAGLPVAMDRDGLTAAQYGLVISLNGILIVALQLPLGRRLEGSKSGPPARPGRADVRRRLRPQRSRRRRGRVRDRRLGVDPGRDRALAGEHGPDRTVLAKHCPRPLPGHPRVVLGHCHHGRAPVRRHRHRPFRPRHPVGRLHGSRSQRRRRLLGPAAAKARPSPAHHTPPAPPCGPGGTRPARRRLTTHRHLAPHPRKSDSASRNLREVVGFLTRPRHSRRSAKPPATSRSTRRRSYPATRSSPRPWTSSTVRRPTPPPPAA